MRLDVYMTEQGMAQSRERAKRLIGAGLVLVNGVTADKPAMEISGAPEITVLAEEDFVGRGGKKLEAALKAFGIDPAGLCARKSGCPPR